MEKQNNSVNKEEKIIHTEEDIFERKFLSTPQLVWRALKRHKLGLISMWVIISLYLLALFADFLSPMNPYTQHLIYKYAPPMKIHRKDPFGNSIGMHIYLYKRMSDPATKKGEFKDSIHFESLKIHDDMYLDEEKDITVSFFKYIPDYDATVTNIEYNIKLITTAVLDNGSEIQIDSKFFRTELIPLGFFNFSKSKNFSFKDFMSPEFSQLTEGKKVLVEEDKRPVAKLYYTQEYYKTKNKLKGKNVLYFKKYAQLESIVITTSDYMEYEYFPENIKAYKVKNYKIKFFIKSWEYKLLWLIPTNIHLFGVEKPLIASLYEDYYTKDGIIYLWGADKYGRDLLSRILFGSRVSLSVGLLGIMITFTIGLLLGGVAGYYGGWIDEILMRITEILMSIPGFYLLISLRAILPTDLPPHITYILIVVILSFLGWPGMTRVIRGMTLGLKETEFIQAAIALGYPARRIIWRHLLPNTATYVIVSATLSIPGYILGEAGLSFLGLGITEPSASWGLMLSQAQSITALSSSPWLLIPGLFIFITVLAFNLFGDAIRDALDPRALGH